MSNTSQDKSTSPWLFIVGAVLVIVLAWAFFAARGAGSQATANESLLLVADLEATLVPGGPDRFDERFSAALEDAETPDLAVDDLLWATLIVGNDGLAEAEDVTATAAFRPDVDPVVLADLASFGSLDAEAGEDGLVLDLADVDAGENALVFLGFDPSSLPDTITDGWAGAYAQTIDLIVVSADDVTDLFYGEAF